MAKIVFCFAGTGDEGDDYASSLERYNSFEPDVIRVYMRGCQHDKVGGGFLFPDLDIVSNSIRNAFNKDDQTIDLEKLKEMMGDGICLIEGPKYLSTHKITDIGLQGFSRGAVTTFAVAKKLDDLNIPMDIIANQPVPGQIAENSPGSLFSKYHDLTKCQNIRSATTFLASHNLENGVIHNSFFQQMAAKFPSTTQANTYIMPHQAHLEWFRHWIIPVHINRQFTQAGYSQARWEHSASVLKNQYQEKDVYFTPKEFSQKVFGIDLATVSKDPVYLEMIQEKAKSLLNDSSIQLSDEQASAIVAISRVNSLTQEQQSQQMNLVIQDNEAGKTFTQIINKTHDVVEYLSHVTRDDPKNKSVKSLLIEEHSDAYKKEIYSKSFDYLSKPAPKDEDKKTFLKGINQADKEFEGKALNVDRGIMRKAMKIIANTILHVTGLFLLANTINLAVTGDWFFFNKTRSANVVNAASSEIKTLASTTQDNITKNQDIKSKYLDTKTGEPPDDTLGQNANMK